MHCDHEPTLSSPFPPVEEWRRGLGRGGRPNFVTPPRAPLVGLEFFWDLELGFWDFSEAWSLRFGASLAPFMESRFVLRACIGTMNLDFARGLPSVALSSSGGEG